MSAHAEFSDPANPAMPTNSTNVAIRAFVRHIVRLPAYVLLGLIWAYQRTISPMLGDVCRYYPSCSRYGAEAISVHGALKGTTLTIRRLLRCTPFHAGGLDPVPPRGRWRISPEGVATPTHE